MSVGLDGTRLKGTEGAEGVFTEPVGIISKQTWLTGDAPVDWKLTNVLHIFKKGWKYDSGNYRPFSLTSVLEKLMKQIFLSAIMQHVQDNQRIRISQHECMKGRSCLTHLISFCDRVNEVCGCHLSGLQLAFDIVSKAFSRRKCLWLGQMPLCWVKNRVDG